MSLFNRDINGRKWGRSGFEDFPEPTFWSKWFGGIIIPMLVFALGARDCIEKQAVLRGRYGNHTNLSGDEAVALGLAWISAACFLHVHYFWTASPRLAVLSELGKKVSFLCAIGSLGYIF